MIHSLYEGIDPHDVRVRVYWALGKDRWSIGLDQAHCGMKPGKVIAWADAEPFGLVLPHFHVNTRMHLSGLDGLTARGTKRNVVAWVTGWIKTDEDAGFQCETRVTFHWPDRRSTFHTPDVLGADGLGAPVRDADMALFSTVRDEAGKAHGKVFAS